MSTRQFLCPRGAAGRVRCGLKVTGQTTAYHVADDGGDEVGIAPLYTIKTVGQYSGTENLDCAHYAGTGLAFAATTPGTITDTANLLVDVLTGDIIVIKGSASNDGVYNVSTGGVAGTIRTTEATALEAAGAVVKIYKRAAHSNNVVKDERTGREWVRYTSDAEDVGIASDGKLVWYDTAQCFELHTAGADLQMIASSHTLRIVGGAGEVAAFDVADVIDCDGFANAINNLPGWVILSVTVNGADLDLVLGPCDNNLLDDLVDEAAGGARDIRSVCRNIFGYCAAANAVSLGGYTDWRVPHLAEVVSLWCWEVPAVSIDAAAFPGWPTTHLWTATTGPPTTANAMYVWPADARAGNYALKTTVRLTALVRG